MKVPGFSLCVIFSPLIFMFGIRTVLRPASSAELERVEEA